jgi:hypothetical protein
VRRYFTFPSGDYPVAQAHNSFKISMQGSFDVKWADYIGDKLVHVETDDKKIPTTTLFGYSEDLSAFLGLLHTFIDLGFPVVDFEYHQGNSENPDLSNQHQ